MISANNVTYRVGKKALFEDVNIKFTEGNCYGLIGANGAGKSTFLKILSGALETTNGDIVITPGQRLSVLEQDHFKYDSFNVMDTVIMGNERLYQIMKEKEAIYAKEDFSDEDGIKASELEAEFAEMDGWDAETNAAMLLNGLGIETDFHYAMMDTLDGNQKVKVLLAKALFGNPDILLLDEPTNHLDMASKDILENALNAYEGTLLYVSHDRYFINRTAHRILELENKQLTEYLGNYDEYLEKKEANGSTVISGFAGSFGTKLSASENASAKTAADNVSASENNATSSGSLDWKAQKEEQARIRKIENQIKKVEAEIEKLENDNSEIESTMADPEVCANSARLNELSTKMNANNERLEELYAQWENLSEEL